MRSLALAFTLVLGVSGVIAGCCKKTDSGSTTTTTAPPAATPTVTARPCSGMATDKDCAACCGAGYRHTFAGHGSCTCVH